MVNTFVVGSVVSDYVTATWVMVKLGSPLQECGLQSSLAML